MNYLFFDIECASGNKIYSPICNFGYVLTDEFFNVLEQKDIIVNPQARFNLTGRKNQEDVILHYSKNVYRNSPTFDKIFPLIKKILEKPNQIVLGHAVNNDINYLIFEVIRYKLDTINLNAYDTQKIYKQYHTNISSISLSDISEEFGMIEEHKHKADDDALKTMNYVKEMCKNLEMSLVELLSATGNKKYNFKEQYQLYILNKSRLKFKRLVKNPKINEKLDQHFSGRIISFSKEIERDYENSLILLQRIINMGGTYTSKVSKSHIFVHNNEKGSARMICAKNQIKEREIKIIDLFSFQLYIFGIRN